MKYYYCSEKDNLIRCTRVNELKANNLMGEGYIGFSNYNIFYISDLDTSSKLSRLIDNYNTKISKLSDGNFYLSIKNKKEKL